MELNWYELCRNNNISECFFERQIQNGIRLYWDYICQNNNLSGEFFDKYEHLGVLNWDYLCWNNNLSENFFEKHIDKLNKKILQNSFRIYHKKEKVVEWLRKNPQYSFDNILEKYILD